MDYGESLSGMTIPSSSAIVRPTKIWFWLLCQKLVVKALQEFERLSWGLSFLMWAH